MNSKEYVEYILSQNKIFLLDTNIWFYHSKNSSDNIEYVFSNISHNLIQLSAITYYEIVCGHYYGMRRANEKRILNRYLHVYSRLDLTEGDVQASGKLRGQAQSEFNNTISIADSLIAGQALYRNLILVTNNISDFEFIPELDLADWHTLTFIKGDTYENCKIRFERRKKLLMHTKKR